jgi:hydroxylamine dehydrogenase
MGCRNISLLRFLPEVINAAAARSQALKEKCERIVARILTQDERIWKKALSSKEAEELRRAYQRRR